MTTAPQTWLRPVYTLAKELKTDMEGFYRIDHDPYHNGPGYSSSDIKNALVSYGYFQHKKEADLETTPAMEFGKAFHMAILEPELFQKRYAVMPKFDRRTKDGKAACEAWLKEHSDKEALSPEDWELLFILAKNVREHPRWDALQHLQPEIMACKKDPDTGFFLKCKADLFGSAIVDFKTTLCAAPWEFNRAVTRYGYHISAAFYQDLVFAVSGERLPFIHVVVEKKPPYGVAFYTLHDDYLDQGRQLYKAGLKRIAKWQYMPDSQRRLHYGTSIQVLHPTTATLYKTKDYLEAIGNET